MWDGNGAENQEIKQGLLLSCSCYFRAFAFTLASFDLIWFSALPKFVWKTCEYDIHAWTLCASILFARVSTIESVREQVENGGNFACQS